MTCQMTWLSARQLSNGASNEKLRGNRKTLQVAPRQCVAADATCSCKVVRFDETSHDNEHRNDKESSYDPCATMTVPIRIPPLPPSAQTVKNQHGPKAWMQRLASSIIH